MKRHKQILFTLLLFAINFLADRITKILAVEFLKGEPPIFFFNKLMIFVYAENQGAFLSMGSGWNSLIKNILLLVLPIIICLYGLYYLMFKEERMYRIVLLSCIVGGGIGNLVDRLFNDFIVTDFMNFGIGSLRTGILNVADLSVTFGAILLIIFEIKASKSQR